MNESQKSTLGLVIAEMEEGLQKMREKRDQIAEALNILDSQISENEGEISLLRDGIA